LEKGVYKAIAVLVFIVILVVGLLTIRNWADEALAEAEDAYTKADEDYWREEQERRSGYGGWFIIATTGAMMVLFMTGILDEEEEEELLADEPVGVDPDGMPKPDEF
jgi:hypothetical protein